MARYAITLVSVLILTLPPNAPAQSTPTRFLPGVHAPGRGEEMLVLDLEGLQVVRLMMNHIEFYQIMDCDDPNDPNEACYKFERLLDGYEAECVEVILTLRITDPNDDHFDYIPPEDDPNQVDQQDILDVVGSFIAAYACRINACQLGNEIFGGPGTYRVDGREPQDWTEDDMEAVFAWLAALADEIDVGAAQAGCDPLTISPALTPGLVQVGARGAWNEDACDDKPFCQVPDCDSDCLIESPGATAAVERTIAFSNAHCDALDVHLHTQCVADLNDVINLIANDPCDKLETELAPNVALTCMEWSAAHGAREWLGWQSVQSPTQTNAHVMFEFLKRKLWCLGSDGVGCAQCDTYGPPTTDEWNTFVGEYNNWLFLVTDDNDNLANFAAAALAAMKANGFMHACYAGGLQRGVSADTEIEVRVECQDPSLFPDHADDIYIYDVTQLRATKTTLDPNAPEAWSDLIRQAFQDAALPYMPLPGDGDHDGDIDWDDFALFEEHMAGPNNEPPDGNCNIFDFDRDIDVDLTDFAAFQTAFGT